MSNWYVIIGEDVAHSLEKRIEARPSHVARLHALQESGRLLLAGPFPTIDCADPGPAGFSGSLIVAEFESLEDARYWAENDPYMLTGVYSTVAVKPFRKTFPQ